MKGNFLEKANAFRDELLQLEGFARQYIAEMKEPAAEGKGPHFGEAIAQATIALRAMEDTRMRYGKVIQYLTDGTSIYDKKEKNG